MSDRFRILCVDGGGIRGLLSVLIVSELERKLQQRDGDDARLADYFHLFSGTSTGGLIALALTAPQRIEAKELAAFYASDGPKIFHRSPGQTLKTLGGFIGSKYASTGLRKAVERHLGSAKLSEATRDVLVTSYDMTNREPFFFKRWRALESKDRDAAIVDAALATSAAPTYFPSYEVDGRALVDGGVFAANPAVAAIAEALGRNEDVPSELEPHDLLVVSVGTGRFEMGFKQAEVSRWGMLGWLLGGGEHPILTAMLGGSSDGTDYWAHMLLNHRPGKPRPKPHEVGVDGPRFYRLQAPLDEEIPMDDASPSTLARLRKAAEGVIEERDAELGELADRLVDTSTAPRGK